MRALSSLILLSASLVSGQRPFFAGTRPIGFPDTPNRTVSLDNRFEGTTEKLPLEANGDRDLVDRLSKLPIDKQPFWFINWQALEEQRKNPQTYPQRPNVFVDPLPSKPNVFVNPSSGSNGFPSNSNSVTQSNSGSLNPGATKPITGLVNGVPNTSNTTPNIQTVDRFGSADSGIPNSNSGAFNSESSNSGSSNSGSSVGNSNSGFLKPNGNKNTVQQTSDTQTGVPAYYPQTGAFNSGNLNTGNSNSGSSVGNSNSGFVKPNGNKNTVQQTSDTQTGVPAYYPQTGAFNSGNLNTGNSNSGSSVGNSNSGFVKPYVNKNGVQQTSDTQTRVPAYYPQTGAFNSGNLNSGNSNTGNSVGNSNSGFVKPSIPSSFGSSGNKNNVQQNSDTQSPVPAYYPQQTIYRNPGYGR